MSDDESSLDDSNGAPTVCVSASKLAPVVAVPSGSTVSRYVVLEEIGHGGMGRVLRAYDPKLQREVALKEVRSDILDRDATGRLVAEARAMAQLSHPNVVAVYDVEPVSATRVVLAMEYVNGQTLKHWLREQPRSWREVLQRFAAAGRGLAAAHEAGLLHRDFKPANVLVADLGAERSAQTAAERWAVKVTDFGLAKTSTGPASGRFRSSGDFSPDELTKAGTVMGTPRYMAPEQRQGRELTAAADQYAFCVALWEALCGAPPFPDEGTVAAKQAGPPAWRDSKTPRAIVAALLRGLSPNPVDRWPSMAELLAELDRVPNRPSRLLAALGAVAASSLAIVSYQAWAQARAQRCSGAPEQLADIWDDATRMRAHAAFAAVDKPFVANAWRRVEDALGSYASDWSAAYTDACEATNVRGEQSPHLMDLRMACLHRAAEDLRSVVEVLTDADASVVAHAHDLTDGLRSLARCSDTEALVADVEPPSSQDAEAVEAARRNLAQARARIKAHRYNPAKEAVEQARIALLATEYGPVQTELAAVDGEVLEKLGEYKASETRLEDAFRLAARWRQWTLMGQVNTLLLAVVGERQRRSDEALRYRPLGEELVRGTGDEGAFRLTLGSILSGMGRHEDAETELRAAVALLMAQLGSEHPRVAKARSGLANALFAAGKQVDAEQEHRTALALKLAAFGPDHPDIATSRSNLANALAAQGKSEAAETELRAALEILDASSGPDHPDYSVFRSSLGAVLFDQGKYAAAEAEQRKTLTASEASFGPNHVAVATARLNLGVALSAQGKHDAAVPELRAALAILEAALGAEHSDVAAARLALADIMLELQRPAEALPLAEVAWTRRTQEGVTPASRGFAAFTLARALWAMAASAEERARARSLAEDALRSLRAAGDVQLKSVAKVRAWLEARR